MTSYFIVIGKVNMDRNCPNYLKEDTIESLNHTLDLVNEYANKYKLIKPIITPRFIPSCSDEMLIELLNISNKYNLKFQSHLSENIYEY